MNISLFIKSVWEWLVIVLIVGVIIVRNTTRGYFWLAKDGSKLTIKQFFKRWGQGIEGISSIQSIRTQMLGTWIIITGVISGLIINLLVRIEYQWYWVSIVLLGSLIITTMSMIGLYQKYKILKKVDDTMRSLEKKKK